MRVGRSRKSSIKLAPCGANGKKRRAALVRRHHAPIYRQSFSPKPVHDWANCVFAAPRAPQARISSLARLILWGFAALPLVEIALFIVVGRAIGLLTTLLLVILAALAGGLLLDPHGLGAIARLPSRRDSRHSPGRAMVEPTLI